MKLVSACCLKLLPLLVLGGACTNRTYLSAGYGRSVGAAIAAQQVNPQGSGGKARGVTGFDAQEARIVAKSYRTSLAAKTPGAPDNRGMVMLAAPGATPTPYLPPPSVPDRK